MSVRNRLFVVTSLALVFWCAGVGPVQPPPAPDLRAAKAAVLVKQLDSADADARHAASVELRNMTGAVLPAVDQAAGSAGVAAKAELKVVLPMLRGRANMEARRRAAAERNLSTVLEAYDKFGKHDPQWDDAARGAIRAFLSAVDEVDLTPADHQRRLALFEKAINAGCRDPLINYFHAVARGEAGLGPAGLVPDGDPVLPRMKVAQDLLDSDYPPECKIPAVLRFANGALAMPYRLTAPADVMSAVDADLGKALDLFPEAAKRADPRTALSLAQALIDNSERREQKFRRMVGQSYGRPPYDPSAEQEFDRKAVFDRLYPALEAAMPGRPEPLVFKGRFYADYAWDARGGDFAANVTPEGWKGFYQRLGAAEEALTKAYQIDPTDPDAATCMLKVVLGQGGDRKMEAWFRRAVAADPDNYDACTRKLYYLEPKWHGSTDAQIAFGQECQRTENWRGRIPLVLVDAYDAVGGQSGESSAYLARDDVWADVRSVYEQYLARFPGRLVDRARFVQLAARLIKWDEVDRQCQVLGEVPPPGVFSGPDAYTQLRARAAEEVGKAGPSKPGAAKGEAVGGYYFMNEVDWTGLATYVTEAAIAVAAGVAVLFVLRARKRKAPPPVPGG
jgi:tetratricopeptide (TPR) repeat protein